MVNDYEPKYKKLEYFLSDQTQTTLKIPHYQRGYSWRSDNVHDFFIDLHDHIKENESDSYYLGTIITIYRGLECGIKVYELIDGQQRLATAIILMVCIRDIFYELSKKNNQWDVKRINRRIFNDNAKEGQDEYFKMTLAKADDEFFRKKILKLPESRNGNKLKDVKEDYDTHKNLKNAYYTMRELINNAIDDMTSTKKLDFLETLVDTLTKRFVIINLIVSKPNKAYELFSRMNNRGLELATSDLTKNLFLSSISKESDIYQATENWEELENSLSKKKNKIDDYIHHYLNTYHSKVINQGKTKFKFIRKSENLHALECILKQTKKPTKLKRITAGDLLDDMLKKFSNYNKLVSCKWNSNDESTEMTRKARYNIGWINELETFIVYPVLMAWLEKYGKEYFETLTDILLKWFFRVKTASGEHPSRLENELARIAYTIINSDSTSAKSSIKYVKKEIKELDISKNRFYSSLMDLELGNKTAKYFLMEVITHKQSIAKLDLHPNTLEHIMPNFGIKKPFGNSYPSNWLEYIQKVNKISDEKDARVFHKRYKNRLGNLTLIHRDKNASLGAKSFAEKCGKCKEDEKCGKYGNSEITITRIITEYNKWGKDEIEDRQKILANIAMEVWEIK